MSHSPELENKEQAQQRADRVKQFRQELAELQREHVLLLTTEQQRSLDDYHCQLLDRLEKQFDIDTSSTARQMSIGMRIVSFLGAIALSAAVFFFFYRFWGYMGAASQVAVLFTSPVLTLLGVEMAARKEKTLYFASLMSLVSITAFVLNLVMLGQIFTITPSQNAFLAWGAYALILAYTYRLKVPLVAGIASILGYLAATIGTWSGIYWLSFGERPEHFIIAGAVIFGISFIPHRRRYDFPAVWRLFGLLVVLSAILILSHWGEGSYILAKPKLLENSYQVAGFLLSASTIWLGIRKNWNGITNLGSVFFVIFLYTKLYDWWWDWMPKYLFFLVIGGIAILLLITLKKLRLLTRGVPA